MSRNGGLMKLCVSLCVVLLIQCFAASPTNSSGSVQKNPLHFMGFFPIGSQAWTGSHICLFASILATEHINNRTDLLPDYELKLDWRDTKCNAGVATDKMYEMLTSPPVKVMILGAGCSPESQATAQASHLWNLTQVAYASSSPALSNRDRFPRFFRIVSSETQFNIARIQLMKIFGWKKVATIHESFELFSDVTYHLLNLLREENISILTAEIFKGDPTMQVENLKRHDARIIVGGFYENRAREILCMGYRLGFRGPRILWMLPGWYGLNWWQKPDPKVPCTLDEMNEAAEGHLLTMYTTKYPFQDRGISGMTSEEWVELIMERLNVSESQRGVINGQCYDTVWAMALALNMTETMLTQMGHTKTLANFTYKDSDINDLITQNMYNVSFMGVRGPVRFLETGESVALYTLEQVQDGVRRQVALIVPVGRSDVYIQWLNGGIKWPGGKAPRDSTSIVDVKSYLPLNVYAPMCTLAGLAIMLALGFLIFNIVYKHYRIIKLSSPNINNVILLGCIIAYSTVFLEPLESDVQQTKTLCVAKSFLFTMGFCTTFGALFSKTWRVYKIFSNKKMKKVKIKDHQLLTLVAILLGVELSVHVLQEILDPVRVETIELYKMVDPVDIDQVYRVQIDVCRSPNSIYFMSALYAINGILLVFGAFLAYESRKVKLEALNDSYHVAICVYNAAILSGVGAVVSQVLTDQITVLYGMVSGFILVGVTATQLLLFVPKIRHLNDDITTVMPLADAQSGVTGPVYEISTRPRATTTINSQS